MHKDPPHDATFLLIKPPEVTSTDKVLHLGQNRQIFPHQNSRLRIGYEIK